MVLNNSIIIAIECKRTLGRDDSIEKSLKQLMDTKDDLETYFRIGILKDEPALSPDWVFVPMIYCEEMAQEVKCCTLCERHIIKGKDIINQVCIA